MAADAHGRRGMWLVLLLTLLAFALRAAYFTGATVDDPVRGDIVDYWAYAWNLVNHGVFSHAAASAVAPAPDAWRGPGYPVFLALCLQLAGNKLPLALKLAAWLQMALGALLVPLTVALGRKWLTANLALLAGFVVAVWPHLVVFSSTLLSETLFALFLLLSLWLFALLLERRSWGLAVAAGLACGLAALVNPIVLLFPPVLFLCLFARGERRFAVAGLLAFVLVAGAWQLRVAQLGASAGPGERARTNLVQGSWPLFHAALNDRFDNEIAAAYFHEVESDAEQMRVDPRTGYSRLWQRIGAEPGFYARWYLLEKPWLLWDWSVRVGWGDVYFLQTTNSPFDRVPVLRALHAASKASNAPVFALALIAMLCSLPTLLRLRTAPAGSVVRLQVALLCCYFTAVHMILQAEPRYAVPYRPLEFLLAVSSFALAAQAWAARRPVIANQDTVA